jgi:hypothetical protein
MTKIVYNACYGGFGLSHEAIMRYAEIKGIKMYFTHSGVLDLQHYYLCTPEEYERLCAEDEANPIGTNRYARSNELYFSPRSVERTDPALVQVVEELGAKANGEFSKLRIAEVPAGTLYRIDEYDGYESVETKDTYDWKVA